MYKRYQSLFQCNAIPNKNNIATSTLIDHIIHKSNWNVEAFNHKMHNRSLCSISKISRSKRKKTINFFQKNAFLKNERALASCLSGLYEKFQNFSFQEYFDEQFNEFVRIVKETVTEHTTTTKVKKNSIDTPWLNKKLKNSLSKKSALFKKYLKYPTTSNFCRFKKFRNNVCNLITEPKKEYYSKKFNALMHSPQNVFQN